MPTAEYMREYRARKRAEASGAVALAEPPKRRGRPPKVKTEEVDEIRIRPIRQTKELTAKGMPVEQVSEFQLGYAKGIEEAAEIIRALSQSQRDAILDRLPKTK